MCEVQRSASEIHRAPVQCGVTGTPTVSTKAQSYQVGTRKKVSRKREMIVEGRALKSKDTARGLDSDQVETGPAASIAPVLLQVWTGLLLCV